MAKLYLILITTIGLLILGSNRCIAKIKVNEKPLVPPSCTVTGEIGCPKGFKPSCPKHHKPSCIFLINKQRPACLANSSNDPFHSYFLDKITCEEIKKFK